RGQRDPHRTGPAPGPGAIRGICRAHRARGRRNVGVPPPGAAVRGARRLALARRAFGLVRSGLHFQSRRGRAAGVSRRTGPLHRGARAGHPGLLCPPGRRLTSHTAGARPVVATFWRATETPCQRAATMADTDTKPGENFKYRIRRDTPGASEWVAANWRAKWWFRWAGIALAALLAVWIIAWAVLARGLPDAGTLLEYEPPLPSVVRGADGEIVHTYARERRVQLQFKDFPAQLVNAYTSAED